MLESQDVQVLKDFQARKDHLDRLVLQGHLESLGKKGNLGIQVRLVKEESVQNTVLWMEGYFLKMELDVKILKNRNIFYNKFKLYIMIKQFIN